MTTEYNTRQLALSIKKYFEVNKKAIEVMIFKGGKRIIVKRALATNSDFLRMFIKVSQNSCSDGAKIGTFSETSKSLCNYFMFCQCFLQYP